MQALLDVILPVFLVIGAGYLAAWRGFLSEGAIDGLMEFTQKIAIPMLLFKAISTLDLGQNIDLALLVSFYTGSLTGFLSGLLAGRYLFKRDWEDSVAIGFCCLFANSVMLGLAITESAYGTAALAPNYAIVAMHSPFCYGIGITAMEIARSRGTPARHMPAKILRAMFRNALVIGILLGLAVNLSGIVLPEVAQSGLDLVVRSAIPCALFAMGGVMFRYRPDGDFRIIAFVCLISLILHPSITYGLSRFNELTAGATRSAVLTATMAPGINAYVFANMYGVAKRVAASSVLIATALSILTIWVWLSILP
ncbi:AEC family transporter [Marinovum sp. 2_MG-2023]|uniref:AEC family transporter n=1 Tax=Roseobacteraceae TaxID=2854170 RepID=UPI001FD5C541|nr:MULTISPECIES: AEC family transporter [Roseobacteraceae]MCJ7873898.1 AEC family transporter [Phaeobacter sp. J2-8]MDO6731898.1 AEC family transporter [Marinovum sp. 2_MG-2023]MDO6781150.1 AEC family transporter [Marinovum sp. 1_MG-2023]